MPTPIQPYDPTGPSRRNSSDDDTPSVSGFQPPKKSFNDALQSSKDGSKHPQEEKKGTLSQKDKSHLVGEVNKANLSDDERELLLNAINKAIPSDGEESKGQNTAGGDVSIIAGAFAQLPKDVPAVSNAQEVVKVLGSNPVFGDSISQVQVVQKANAAEVQVSVTLNNGTQISVTVSSGREIDKVSITGITEAQQVKIDQNITQLRQVLSNAGFTVHQVETTRTDMPTTGIPIAEPKQMAQESSASREGRQQQEDQSGQDRGSRGGYGGGPGGGDQEKGGQQQQKQQQQQK